MLTNIRALQMNISTIVTRMLPVIFLSHGGGPCFFMESEPGEMFSEIDKNSKAAAFYRGLQTKLQITPASASSVNTPTVSSSSSSSPLLLQPVSSILVISAHWENNPVSVLTNPSPSLYYDYYGFPPETYKLSFPAPGATALATRVQELLKEKGIECGTDPKRGFDHGVFIPLKLIFPEANVPITQLSIHPKLDPKFHLELGAALAPLRKEGVLIIGSGQTTHNLRDMNPPGTRPSGWALEFEKWLDYTLLSSTVSKDGSDLTSTERLQRLQLSPSHAPHFRKAHPREEHFTPLLVAAGAAFSHLPNEVITGSNSSSSSRNTIIVRSDGSTNTEPVSDESTSSSSLNNNHPLPGTVTKLYSQFVLGSMSLASYRFD